MDILNNYLAKHSNFPAFIEKLPAGQIKNIIVIPCCNEPELIKTMNSLQQCTKPMYPVEVIVVINSSESASNQVISQNSATLKELTAWCASGLNFITHIINIEQIDHKTAGVGFARKTGMDEAIRRFILSGQENGIITGLDADSTVDENYLVEIEKLFTTKCNGCSINFEHPIVNNGFSNDITKRITEYELYLRYYKLALQFTGFPYFHFTVGSSFSVSAKAYCKSGGMNKRQAGEDFYFLQKVMPLGNYFALNSTCVYPSPRPSDRVPFGTGAFINQYIAEPTKTYLTYNFETFLNLKLFLNDIELMYKADNLTINSLTKKYHHSLQAFLNLNKFDEALHLANSNSAQLSSFKKRFFQWFDAFKILKYMNFAHQNYYERESLIDSINLLFHKIGKKNEGNLNETAILLKLRSDEKTK